MKIQLLDKRHLHFPSARPRVSSLPALLVWSFDCHSRIPCIYLDEHALRARLGFVSTPEIKQ